MKILGIDYGDKKIGLSLSADKLALPWQTLKNFTSPIQAIDQIVQIIFQEKIDAVVVGWPLSLSGKFSSQTRVVEDFIDKLKQKITIPLAVVDERFSSQLAQAQAVGKNDDAQAAANILQSYLDQQSNQ